jgi:4-hydroxyacetophenone monooxygenase
MSTIEMSVRPERPELLMASDEFIDNVVTHADPMAMRGLLYMLTGDLELEQMPLEMRRFGRVEQMAPASDADAEMIRRKAADFLKAYRDSGAGTVDYGTKENVAKALDLAVGERIMEEARDLMVEETALDPWCRSLEWRAEPDPKALEKFHVTIIGAAMGGLNAALQLRRAGISYDVIEKNDEVSGTWYENHYPGARVDTPSRGYTNLIAVDYPYPRAFGTNEDCQNVFEWTSHHFGLRDSIAFNTEVRSMAWDDEAGEWEIVTSGPDGEKTQRANAVITAVGLLARPNIPNLEGMDEFEGPSWHTARWPKGADLRGKRVAVIGTGCTGYQMIPVLAKTPEIEITVFQRTPNWMFPVPGYTADSKPELLWLDRNMPFHANFLRFKTIYGSGPDFVKMFDIDPNFKDPHSVSPAGAEARQRAISFLESKISNPDLLQSMIPDHPVWSARPVVVDPEDCVLDAIQRDNVTLVPQGIQRITKTGIIASDGSQHDVDVIVFATGFKAHDVLWPMTITGKDGQDLQEYWKAEGARAYLGTMVPKFPNLWMLYGPNTNGGLGVPQYHEVTTRYVLQGLEKLILEGKKSIDVKEDAYWSYAKEVDEGNMTKVWSDPRGNSYWWSGFGRSVTNTPFMGFQIRERMLEPNWNDLIVE